jgi:hypothetical protein
MSNPPHLYRYQWLTAHSLASLLNDTVWLSSPTTFNDPFDCAITLSSGKLKESLDHSIAEIARRNNIPREQIANHNKVFNQDEQAYEWLRNSLKNTMQSIGVLCFSATPSEILMWSHYANNHKGFCVEYDCSEGSHLRRIARPVSYSETIPSLSLANLPDGAESKFLDVCIFTKAKQWEYEQEWRVIMHEGERSFQAPARTTSIIFGARMPTEEKVMLYRAMTHKEGIEFRETKLLEDRFAIDFNTFTL